MAALAAGLTSVVFLVGFASVRLRSQRDRALSRSDSLAANLAQRSADGKLITDRDVERTADAYADANQLDPMSKTTVFATWSIFALMIVLALIATAQSATRPSLEVARWNLDTWAALFVLAVAGGIATIGSIEFRWIRGDLDSRLRASAMGKVRGALAARRASDLTLALDITNQVLEELDAWPWALAFRSQLHAAMGQSERAIKDLDRAVALDPENPWHRIARAELLLGDSQSSRALEDLEAIGHRMPNEPEVLRLYGSALLADGRREDALQAFARALTASPADIATRLARGRALADGHELHDENPLRALRSILLDEGQRVAVASVVSKARERLLENDLRTAIEDFTLILEHDPQNADALASRGHARLRLGLKLEAQADFDEALERTANRAKTLDQMALAHRAVGDRKRAIEYLTQAIECRASAWRYLQRGMTFDAEGEYGNAEEDYALALELRPNFHEAAAHRAYSLGRLGNFDASDELFLKIEVEAPGNLHNLELWVELLLIRRHRPAEALEVVSRAIDATPFEGRLYATRARVQVALKRYASAHSDLEAAETFGADRSLVALDRSSAYFDIGDFEAAEKALASAAGLSSPYRIAVLANHATLLRRLERLDEALAQLDQAIELSLDNERLLVSRGCLLMLMSEMERAALDFDRAIEINERSSSALWHRARLRASSGDIDGALADIDNTDGYDVGFAAEVRGYSHFRQREWREAADLFQTAIAASEGDEMRIGLMSSLAAAYDNLGEFGDAEVLFRKIASQVSDARSRLRLGICLSQQGKDAEATEFFRQVREQLGDAAQSLFDENVVPGALLEAERVLACWEGSGSSG